MTPHPEQRNLGGLDTLVVPGDPNGPLIVLLHGFGADAWDLVGLAQMVDVPRGTTWLFPNAPLEVDIGPHITGRAWFPIDMMALQLAMLAGRGADLANQRPRELGPSRKLVEAMLQAYGADPARTVIGGFSQGAMVATDWTLHAAQGPAGLVVLSGTLVDRDGWASLAAAKAGQSFFQSHGRRDPLLQVEQARALCALLNAAGWLGELREFAGEHEIPMGILQALGPWISDRLAQS